MLRVKLSLVLALLVLLPVAVATAEPLPHRYETFVLDSGDLRNAAPEGVAAVFDQVVEVEGATWLRLYFDRATLAPSPGSAERGATLRLTSLKDGAVQIHTPETLEQWQFSSAFFNGSAVRVELLAEAGAPASRVRVFEVMVGEHSGAEKSICGPTDDRTLSTDPRAARIVPVGCTAWFFDDAQNCLLTAGHCIGANSSVLELNVPLSNPDGSVNHPGPEDQYPIDQSSIQWVQNTSIGNDWAYFGAFPNGVTGLTAYEAQGGNHYVLADPPLSPNGEQIRVTGYGSIDGTQGTPLDWSQVQTTHVGDLTNVFSTVLQYTPDTTGGNSGSAVHVEGTDTAIGIHTNAGCTAVGGANQGTSLANTGLQDALAAPIGICLNGLPDLSVTLTNPMPDPMPAEGTTVEIDVLGPEGVTMDINGATLVYDNGSGDQTVAFTDQGKGRWAADLPALTCGSDVTLRIDVESTGGTMVHLPFTAINSMDRRYIRGVGQSHDRSFGDDFETDMGWTVDNDPSLTAGAWERGFTAGYGTRNDPPWDADGSGMAFLTDPAGGNTDVDSGATRLISPTMDATGEDPYISYWRWYSDENSANLDDAFTVEISNDDGSNWTTLESIGPDVIGEWVKSTFRIADFVSPTDQMRLRFTAADLGGAGIVEAGVDGVSLTHGPTGLTCTAIFSDGFESGNVAAWDTSVP